MDMPDGGGTSSNNTSNTTMDMSSSSMVFSTQLPFNLLFSGWVVSTSGQLAGAWFACFFLAISFQVLQVRTSELRGFHTGSVVLPIYTIKLPPS
jgi:hypothetical protein